MSERPQLQKQPSKYEIRQRLSSIDNELRISKVDLSHLNALSNNKDTESQWKERVIAIEKSTKRQSKLERKRHGRYSTGNIATSNGGGSGSDGIGTSLKDRLATFQKASESINYYSDDESTVGPKGKNKKSAAQLLKEQYAKKQRLAGKRAVEKRMTANSMGNSSGLGSGLNALSSLRLRDMGMTADGCRPKLVRANSADSIFSNDDQDDNSNKGCRAKGGGGLDIMGVGKPTSTKRVSMTSKVSSSTTTTNNNNHQEEDDQSVLSSNYELGVKQRLSKFGLSASQRKTQSQRLAQLKSSNRKSGIHNTEVVEKRMSAKEKMLHAKQLAEKNRLAGIKEKDKRGEKLNAKEKILLAKSVKDGKRKAKVEGIDKKEEEERNERAKEKEEEAQQLIDAMMLDMYKDDADESAAVTPPSDTEPGGTSPEKKMLTAKEKMMQAKALRDSKRTTKQQPQVDTNSPTEVTAAAVDKVSMTLLKKDQRSSEPSNTPFIPTLTIDGDWQKDNNDNDVNEKKGVTDFYRPTSRRMANKDTVSVHDDQEVKTTSSTGVEKNDTPVVLDERMDTSKEKKLTAKENMLQAKALRDSKRVTKDIAMSAVDCQVTSRDGTTSTIPAVTSANQQKSASDSIFKQDQASTNKSKSSDKIVESSSTTDSTHPVEKSSQKPAVYNPYDKSTWHLKKQRKIEAPTTTLSREKSDADSKSKPDVSSKTVESAAKVTPDDKVSTKLLGSSVDKVSSDNSDQVTSSPTASDNDNPQSSFPPKPMVYNPYDMSTWHLKKSKTNNNDKVDESPATAAPKKETSIKEKSTLDTNSKTAVKDTASSVVHITSSTATDNSTTDEKSVNSLDTAPSQQKKLSAKEKMLLSKALAHSKRLEKLTQEKKRQEAIDEAWLADKNMSSAANNEQDGDAGVVTPVYTTQNVKATAKSDTSKLLTDTLDQVTPSSSTEQKKDVSSSNEKIVDSLGKMMSAKEMSMRAKPIAQSNRLAASDQATPTASKVDNPRPVSEFKKLFGSGAVSQDTVERIKVEKQPQLAQEKTLSRLEKDRHAHTTDKSNGIAGATPVDTPLVKSSTTKVESSLSTDKNDKAEKRRLAKEKLLQAKALTQSKRLERQAALDARANRLADLEKKSANNQRSTFGASSTNELYQTKKKLVSSGQAVSMMKETYAGRTSVSTSVTQATSLERIKAETVAAEKTRQEALDAAWLANQSMTSREGSLANLDVSHRSTSSTDYNMIEESSLISFTKKELFAREKMIQAKARASRKRSSISKRLEKLTDGIDKQEGNASLNDDANKEVLDKQINKTGTVIAGTAEQKDVSTTRAAEKAAESESNASFEKKMTAKEKMIQAKALIQSKQLKKVAEEKKRQEAIDEAWLAEQEGLPTKDLDNIVKSSNESKNVSESKKTVIDVQKKSTNKRSVKVQGQVAPVITITTSDVQDSAFTSKFKKEIVNEAAIEKPKMKRLTKGEAVKEQVESSSKTKSDTGSLSTTLNATPVVKKSTSEKKLTAKERMVAAKARAQQKRLAAQLERERLEKVKVAAKEAEAEAKKANAKKLDKVEAEKKHQAALDAAWLSEQLEEAEDEESEERLELEQKSRAAAKAAYRRRSAHGSSNISDGEDNMIGNSSGGSMISSGGLGSLGLLSALPSSKKKVSKCLRSVTENEDDDASVFTTKTIQTLQSQHTNAAKSVSSRSYYSRIHDEASIVDIIKDKTRAKLGKKQLPRNPQILKTYKQWEIYHLENGRLYSTIEGELWSQKCYKNNPNGFVSRPVLPPDDRIAAVKAFLIARGLGRDDIKY